MNNEFLMSSNPKSGAASTEEIRMVRPLILKTLETLSHSTLIPLSVFFYISSFFNFFNICIPDLGRPEIRPWRSLHPTHPPLARKYDWSIIYW